MENLEELLRASEERLRLVTEAAELGIWMWHIHEDRVTWENDRPYTIFGIDPSEGPVNAARFRKEFVHPEDADRFDAAVLALMRTGERFFFQGRFIRKDGDVRWVEFAGNLVNNNEGTPGWLLGTAKDITALKRAEQALTASEARYRNLFEGIDEGCCVCQLLLDAQGAPYDIRLLEVNPAFEVQTGLRDVVGRTLRELVPRLDPAWIDIYGKVAIRGESVRFEQPANAMGRVFNVFATPTGHPQDHKFILVFTDITERNRVEEALRASDQRKSEFLATLAHELRNPLAPLRTGLELWADGSGDQVDVYTVQAMMKRQMEQMVRLVDDLMDVSRVNLGKIELRMERMELAQVIHQAAEGVQAAMVGSDKKLSISLPAEALYIQGDRARIAQVVGNLLNNASKFTAAAGRVQLSMARVSDQVTITIADDGIGMTPDEINRIFDLFVQADVRLERSTSGLGIGLTLSKRLVELHKGTITAASEGPGLGSTFTITLPLANRSHMAPRSGGAEQPNTPMIQQRILVVDDNRDAAESLATLLRHGGHTVRVAYDGLEAMVAAGTFDPDLLLLDIGLPNLHGYEVARQIRSKAWGTSMYIVALTGWGQPEDHERSAEVGIDEHWVKPVDIAQLKQFLRTPRRKDLTQP